MPSRCKKAYNDPFGTNPPYLAIHAAAQLPKPHRTSAKLPKNYSKSQNRLLTLSRSQLPKPQDLQHIRRQNHQDPQRHYRAEYRRRKRVVGRKPRDPLRGFACSLVGSAQRGTEVFPGAEHGFQSREGLGGEVLGPAAGLMHERCDVGVVVGICGGGVHQGGDDAGGGLVGAEGGVSVGDFFGEVLMVGREADRAVGGGEGEAGEEGGEEVGHLGGMLSG